MNDLVLMDVLQSEGDLHEPGQNLLLREVVVGCAALLDEASKVAFRTEVHDDAEVAPYQTSFLPVVHEALSVLHYEGMAQCLQRVYFVQSLLPLVLVHE